MAAPGADVLSILTAGKNPPSGFQQLLDMADDPAAPDFVGALSADGKSRSQDDLQPDNPLTAGGGALSAAQKRPKSRYDTIADELLDYGGGPLSQASALKQARQQASQAKRSALENAKARIKELDKLMPDPRQAWALGIGAPTRTGRFSEAISNAYMMRQNAMDQRREQIMQQARALSELDLAQANLGWEEAQADAQDQDRRQRLAEQFMQQARIEAQAQENADIRRDEAENRKQYYADLAAGREADRRSREDIAEQNRQAREDAAGRVTWQAGPGPDPKNPSRQIQGMWELPNRPGQKPIFHAEGTLSRAGAGGANSGTALMKNAQFYVDKGIAPDIPTAVDMLQRSVNDRNTFLRLVALEKKAIKDEEFDIDDAEAERRATENVRRRTQAYAVPAGEPLNANTPTNPGFKTDVPLPARRVAQPSQPPAQLPRNPAQPPAAAAPPPNRATNTLPPQIAARLKEGVATTMSDGSKWTLKNGQPVRLQ